jgi:hypothetical protein
VISPLSNQPNEMPKGEKKVQVVKLKCLSSSGEKKLREEGSREVKRRS